MKKTLLLFTCIFCLLVFFNSYGQFYESSILGEPASITMLRFKSVNWLARDADGNIFVTDATFNRVTKFDANGNPLLQWGSTGSGDGQFNSPQGIAVDASGNVYVADYSNHRIQKFSNTGDYLDKWGAFGTVDGQFNGPNSLAIDASGNVFVIDQGNNRVQKFNNQTGFEFKWGATGTGDGQFNTPYGIAVDASGNVYVTEWGNDRVQKFNNAGTFTAKWGTLGSGNTQFNNPTGITIGGSNVYVVDQNNNRVVKFSSSGVYSTKWGTAGTGNGQFNLPIGITTDAGGNIYIGDNGNYRIQKFTGAEFFSITWGTRESGNGFFNPAYIAIDVSGNLYASDPVNDYILKFNSSGSFLTKWGGSGTGDGQFASTSGPGGVAVDVNGNVFVTDPGNHRVQKFSNTGTFLTKWGAEGSADGQFISPEGIAIDANENVLVLDKIIVFGQYRVQKFSSNGSYITKCPVIISRHLAVDADGLYIGSAAYYHVHKYDNTGNLVKTWGNGEGGRLTVNGLHTDTNGNIFVSDVYSAHAIHKFNNIGSFLQKWGTTGSGNGQFNDPRGIATDAAGNVYVADYGNKRIQKFAMLQITSFSSAKAAVGGTVTITGKNFSAVASENTVSFNGVNATVTAATTTNLTVVVPTGATTGPVTVSRSGISVNSAILFVVSPFEITSFTPEFGIVGTVVSISGTGFSNIRNNNVVKFNGITAPFYEGLASTPTVLYVTVPVGGLNGKISVTIGSETTESTATFDSFSFTGFSPSSGLAGSSVTITGTGLTSASTVKFNGVTAVTSNATGTSITATIPATSTTGKISITRASTTLTSTNEFLRLPFAITSFSPSIGDVAAIVTIMGTGFSTVAGNNVVKFNGLTAVVTQNTATQLKATVPTGGLNGKITVTTAGVTAQSTDNFESFTLTGFSPASGVTGSTVTLTGTGLTSAATVKFNGVTAVVTNATSTSMTVTVSANVTTGKITVTRESSTLTSANEFLSLPFAILSFSPGIGSAGTSVTITGTGFSSVAANNSVTFNDVPANVTSSTPTSITATVPSGGLGGKIKVIVAGQTATSAENFYSLTMTGFTPLSATAGTAITLTGTGFSASSVVKFNDTPGIVTSSTPTSMAVTVPANVTTGKITVTREGTTVTSSTEFLSLPFQITSFDPVVAMPGNLVTITGLGFSRVTANNLVKFNGEIAVVNQSSPTEIKATVPVNASNGLITVTVGGQTATAVADFKVTRLSVTNKNFPVYHTAGSASSNVTVTVNSITEVQGIKFLSKGITANENTRKTENVPFSTSNTITFTMPESYFSDPLGLTGYFVLTDQAGNEIVSEKGYVYIRYPSSVSDHVVPGLSFGKSVKNYQIISIPLKLKNNSVSNVFDELGEYDNSKWRLYSYSGNSNTELNASAKIETGKGYWLIVKDKTVINPGEGNTVEVTEDEPFTITLSSGGNLIGNPYNFDISWSDVLEFNNSPQGVGNLIQYSNGVLAENNTLERYRGAFVRNTSGSPITIKVPVNSNSMGGRKSDKNPHKNPIDSDSWTVNLTLDDGLLRNELGGFGMHPHAKQEEDEWDEVAFPFPGASSFKLVMKDLAPVELIKDIVATAAEYSWSGEVTSEHGIAIYWHDIDFGTSNKQLVLEADSRVELIDMHSVTHTNLPAGKQRFKIHYGDPEYINAATPVDNLRISHAYPNPLKRTSQSLSIALALPEKTTDIQITFTDMLGKQATLPPSAHYDEGRHIIEWKNDFTALKSGIYLLHMLITKPSGNVHFYRKILVE